MNDILTRKAYNECISHQINKLKGKMFDSLIAVTNAKSAPQLRNEFLAGSGSFVKAYTMRSTEFKVSLILGKYL